ncbi:MAG: peptidoglycan DD-metalloendopeptidase family protein [Planctomycetes bacterium]|nr:peptidoglycan DD-metalloendopeptidase family protein [Planctomycetota bacterium]
MRRIGGPSGTVEDTARSSVVGLALAALAALATVALLATLVLRSGESGSRGSSPVEVKASPIEDVREAVVAREPEWPFAPTDRPRPVANLFHSPLRPGTEDAYFHGGIDIRAERGTPVFVVARGRVRVYREGAYDNVVLTEPDGGEWEYRHLALDSVPAAARAAERDGTDMAAGSQVGVVGAWADGLDYDHLHLNRRAADGRILDPLRFLARPPDGMPPELVGIHLVKDGGDEPLVPDADGAIPCEGRVDVVVVARDFMDGERWTNPPVSIVVEWPGLGLRTRLSPFERGLPLAPARPVPRYPRGPALCVYLQTGPLATTNRIPLDREAQRFAVVATNADGEGLPDPTGCWDTTTAPDGEHALAVTVYDAAGNSARGSVRARVGNRH